MTAAVIRADARALPLPDDSVDLIVTSPPYFALRDYRDGDGSLTGQIGAEATPQAYVAALLECTREWMRVLRPSGSLFVNLGDKYAGAPSGPTGATSGIGIERGGRNQHDITAIRQTFQRGGAPNKSLMGLPWRYALGCIDDLGLILRAEVIWSKPNGLPESVTDRVRRSHEHWFHLTKEPRYYSAVDEIRMPSQRQAGMTWEQRKARGDALRQGEQRGTFGNGMASNPLGSLPGSVWEIPTQPLKVPAHLDVDHFAAFPSALPMRIIAGWSPPGICTACGEGRRPITDVQKTHAPRPSKLTALTSAHGADGREGARPSSIAHITGYACACPTPDAPTRPALVVDPFGGTGTTALAARALGRRGISFDLSHDYARLAQWRTQDPGELARVLGNPKPAVPVTGQLDMFGEPA